MARRAIALVSLVVREDDEALDFHVGTLGFAKVEDPPLGDGTKRWVAVFADLHGNLWDLIEPRSGG